MIHYRSLTSYIPKTSSYCVSNRTELFPVKKNFPILSTADAVTIESADIMEVVQNLTPSRRIPHLGENQTTDIKQLVAIFNTDVPQAPAPPPPAQLPRVEIS